MRDNPVHRAYKQGVKTAPIEHKRPKRIRGNVELTPDELALALDLARSDRLEQQLHDYSARKRVTS